MLLAKPRWWLGRSLVYDYRYGLKPKAIAWRKLALLASIVILLIPVLSISFFKSAKPTHSRAASLSQLTNDNVQTQAKPVLVTAANDTPKIDVRIQPVLDKWALTHAGQSWGVSALGTDSTIGTASLNGDQIFTTESLYKLFVAYLGYQKIDDGTFTLTDPYLNGWSRGRCLDEMIRNSNSPCAEKMMAKLGKPAIDQRLRDYGLTHTSMSGLTTSAHDVTALLARLQAGRDLSSITRQLFLDSMLGQEYRSGLPAGFSPNDVYNKVGFRGYDVYNDAAIVALPNKHFLIITVLTQNASTRAIAQLASQINESIEP